MAKDREDLTLKEVVDLLTKHEPGVIAFIPDEIFDYLPGYLRARMVVIHRSGGEVDGGNKT